MSSVKVDVYKEHKSEYITPKKPTLLKISPASYLTIEGKGFPGDAAFTTAIGALYNTAFTIKMARKFAGRDYTVTKLEGLWWDPWKENTAGKKQNLNWHWKLMIRVPEFIARKELKEAITSLLNKGKDAAVGRVKLETLKEGRCVQVLHVGPYTDEAETIALMKDFATEQGLTFSGLHHEIYLSDPRRVAPERLRTILRQPVR